MKKMKMIRFEWLLEASVTLCLGYLGLLASIPAANAADPIQLGNPSYGGSGCPQGSASATLSPDGSALSILFDEYKVEVGGTTRKRLDRANCAVGIPVHVPQGLSVALINVDYRGFNALPAGGMSRLSVEYFFAGQRGPQFSKTFTGGTRGINEDFLQTTPITAAGIVWSACGRDVILRANTSLMTMTNARLDEALSSVDSADVGATLVYHLQWRTCGDDTGTAPIQF